MLLCDGSVFVSHLLETGLLFLAAGALRKFVVVKGGSGGFNTCIYQQELLAFRDLRARET